MGVAKDKQRICKGGVLGLRWRGGMRKLVAVIQAVWPGVESPGNQTSGDMVMKKWMLVLAVGALVPVSSWAAMQGTDGGQ